MTYDAGGEVNMTYNLTSPADGYIGANNATYVRKYDVTLKRVATMCHIPSRFNKITGHSLVKFSKQLPGDIRAESISDIIGLACWPAVH